ncbi:MAG: ABC-2 type transport system permease protein [Myxococcota bacterium]|jgi:ABC-2 type transport system permease protein
MKRTLAIARREFDAYFATAIGWLSLSGFILLTGFIFAWIVTAYADQATQASMNPYGGGTMNVNEHLLPDFFGTTSVILLLLTPALSMRLFSEDLKQRSMELLLSSPVTSGEIVLGKYLGAVGFLAIMLLSTAHYMAILWWLSNPDPAVVLANYAGTFLMASAFLAVGLLTSAMTQSQLIALVLSFGTLLLLWFMSGIGSLATGTAGEVLSYLSVLSHIEELSRGLLHTKDIVYYMTFIGFFLFATLQRVEAMRWQ